VLPAKDAAQRQHDGVGAVDLNQGLKKELHGVPEVGFENRPQIIRMKEYIRRRRAIQFGAHKFASAAQDENQSCWILVKSYRSGKFLRRKGENCTG
jgi:hypothetical protein